MNSCRIAIFMPISIIGLGWHKSTGHQTLSKPRSHGSAPARPRDRYNDSKNPSYFRAFTMRRVLIVTLVLCLTCAEGPASTRTGETREPKTRNVIVVTLDGFRWQEFFHGADEVLIDKKLGGVPDV